MNRFCQHPDRDVPALVCGYPLPCPYHTAEIVPGPPVVVTVPIRGNTDPVVASRLCDIGEALQDEEDQ